MSARGESEGGFTLLELMIVAGIVPLLLASLYSFYRSQLYAVRTEEVTVMTKEEADVGIDFMVKELRIAGARPETYPVACGAVPNINPLVPACTGFERLPLAQSQQIRIQFDFRGDAVGSPPDGCPNDPGEQITYAYVPSARAITRQVNDGNPAAILVQNVSPSAFQLIYRDAGGAVLTNPSSASARAVISTVEIVLASSAEHPSPDVFGPIATGRRSKIFLRNPRC